MPYDEEYIRGDSQDDGNGYKDDVHDGGDDDDDDDDD